MRRREGLRREFLAALACAAVVLAAYSPVVFGGRTFDESTVVAGVNGPSPPPGLARPTEVDAIRPDPAAGAWQTVAWGRVVHDEIAHGHWPLWNPDQGAGAPLAGGVQSATYNPLLAPFFLHPTSGTWDLSLLASFVLGALAMYALLRTLGLGIVAAVVGSSAYTLGGWFAMDTSDGFVVTYAYLPLLLFAVERVARSSRTRWVALLGAVLAAAVVAGMPESSFFMLAAAAAFALYRVLVGPPGAERSAASAGRRAVRLGAGAVLGLGLSLPLILEFGQFLSLSLNTHDATVGARTGALRALAWWAMPFLNGYPRMPRLAGIPADRGWVGASVLCLSAAAAAAPKAMRRTGGWFLLALGMVVLLKNHHTPGFAWIGSLPGFNRADSTAFAGPLAQLGLAAAAGFGVHAIATGRVQRRYLVLTAGVLGAGTLALLVANRRVIAVAHNAALWRTLGLAGGASAIILGAVWLAAGRRSSPRLRAGAALAVSAVLLAELLALFPRSIYPGRADPYAPPSWLATVRAGLAGAPGGRVFGIDEQLYPDTAGALGLADPATLDGLYVKRYATFVRDFVSTSFTDRFTGDGIALDDIEGNPMFDLLGVRYVVAAGRPPTQTAQAAAQYRPVAAAPGVGVFQNADALARAFVVGRVAAVPDEPAAVAYLRRQGAVSPSGVVRMASFDPGSEAVVETATGTVGSLAGAGVGAGAGSGVTATATIAAYGPDRVVVEVRSSGPGLLVLSDTFCPGWQASVNGRASPVLATDVAFRGVVVGAGASTVVFSYRAPGGNLEWAIPLASVLVVIAAGILRRRRRVSQSRQALAAPHSSL